MATTIAMLEAKLHADTSKFDKAMGKSDSTFSKVGKSIGKVALGVGAAIGVGLGVTAKVGFDEFIEGQKVVAQTNAVLKSTAGIANVTAKEVSGLAESLMKKSGVDDEAIASGENLLLTFTNIRNEVGKNNDIFNQATEIALDMSVALGQDMTQSAMQLGKALNDPVRGLTALRKVGVTFTAAQEELIKKLVETGDVAGAQKVILQELRKEFGGSAKAAGDTLGGQLNILKETFSNVAGEIVGSLMPTLVRFARWILDRGMPVVAGLAGALKDLFSGKLPKLKLDVAFSGLSSLGKKLFGQIEKILMGSAGTLKPLKLDSGKIIEFERVGASSGLVVSLQKMFEQVDWERIGKRIGEAIGDAIEVTNEWVGKAFTAAADWLDSHTDQIAEMGLKIGLTMITKLTDPQFWKDNWQLIGAVMITTFPLGRLGTLAGKIGLALIRPLARLVPSSFGRIGARAIDEIGHQFRRLPATAQEIFRTVARLAQRALGGIVKYLEGKFKAAWAKVPGWIKAAFRLGAVLGLYNGILRVIDAVRDLINWLGDLAGKITSLPDMPSLGDIGRGILGGGNAAGTSNWRGGPTWVGERGPELVNLPQGSRVYSNGVSTAMAGDGGGTTIILNVPSSALVVDAGKLVRYIDDARRTYGRRGGA